MDFIIPAMQIVSTAIDIPKSLIGLVFSLAFLLSTFTLILFGAGLYVVSTYNLKHGHEIISNMDYLYRCVLYPDLAEYILFFDTVANYWEKVTCWTNSFGLFNRLLSSKYLVRAVKHCLNGASFLNVVQEVALALGNWFDNTILWIFSNPFLNTYPIYPTTTLFSVIATEVRKFLQCECNLLDPLYKILTEPYHDSNLYCSLHH